MAPGIGWESDINELFSHNKMVFCLTTINVAVLDSALHNHWTFLILVHMDLWLNLIIPLETDLEKTNIFFRANFSVNSVSLVLLGLSLLVLTTESPAFLWSIPEHASVNSH